MLIPSWSVITLVPVRTKKELACIFSVFDECRSLMHCFSCNSVSSSPIIFPFYVCYLSIFPMHRTMFFTGGGDFVTLGIKCWKWNKRIKSQDFTRATKLSDTMVWAYVLLHRRRALQQRAIATAYATCYCYSEPLQYFYFFCQEL